VHLSKWPKYDVKNINKTLENNFSFVFNVIEKGLAERDREQIGLKWPLKKATISSKKKLNRKFEEIIKRQLNVKKVAWKKSNGEEIKVKLDTKLTKDLESEGFSREIARRIQAERKKKGLYKEDRIDLKIDIDSELRKRLEKYKEFLMNRTGSKKLEFVEDKIKSGVSFKVKGKIIKIDF